MFLHTQRCFAQTGNPFFACRSIYRVNNGEWIMSEANTCGCGRSPTGKCCGWHNLTEEQYAEKKAQWEAKQEAKKAS